MANKVLAVGGFFLQHQPRIMPGAINGGRIQEEYKSYLSIWSGVAVVIVFGMAIYFFTGPHHAIRGILPYNPNRPVPTDQQLHSLLKDEQYRVTRENATEPAFQNQYWNNDRPGVYVDIITGDPLFSSTDKFDAQNGRLNFSKPISKDRIVERKDVSHDIERIEIRTARSNSHLGHLFPDGPPPAGQRYVVNSAAVKFIPEEEMKADGYGDYLSLFPNAGATK